jgi:hypothetical protein
MFGGKWILGSLLIIASFSAPAQKIVYSEYDKDDTRRLNFEIAGKIGSNFLIYKNIRNKSWIVVFDNEMQQLDKVEQDFVPDNDRMINVDFFSYGDFCYMIYQYQRRSIVYCCAAKIDGNGKKIGEVMQLDTTQIGFAANNKLYTVLSSEDKNRLIVFKINSKNKRNYTISTLLMDKDLNALKRSRLSMPMEDRDDDFLGEFQLDNDGDLVFTKFNRVNSENIGEAAFVIKYAQADSFMVTKLNLEKTYLDEIHIKPDNYNKRYFLTSFFFKERRGNTDGYYFYIWDKQSGQVIMEDTILFNEELRKEAKGNSTAKMAFNDYLCNIIQGGLEVLSLVAKHTIPVRVAVTGTGGITRMVILHASMDYYYYSPSYNNYW